MTPEIVLELPHKRNNPRNSEGAFIDLSGGRIMFAYSRYYGSSWSDVATATISARFSLDGGKTWSKRDKLLVANEGKCNVMSPSLLRLRDGRIALFYLRTNNFHDCRMHMRTSDDEGKSWSESIQCINAPGYFVVNNDRVIQLKCGRIIIPAAYHRPKLEASPSSWDAWDFRAITIFYYSDDDGLTWSESRDWWSLPVYSESGMQEPGVIERTDGHLYAWARTDTGRQWETWSFDSGVSWSPPRPSPFYSPNSSLSVKRLVATGDLLAIWNDYSPRKSLPTPAARLNSTEHSSWGRTPLALALSNDEGASWKHNRLLEDDPQRGYCYTAIHSVDDAVLVAYCCGGSKSGVLQNLCVRMIPLSWLYGEE